MSKISKEEQARLSGIQRGLEIAENKGIEALREEVEFRCKYKIPLACDMKDVGEALKEIQDNMLSTIMLMSVFVLRDEFGFGKERVKRFTDKYIENSKQLLSKDLNWADVKEAMEEEIGFKCELDDYFLSGGK